MDAAQQIIKILTEKSGKIDLGKAYDEGTNAIMGSFTEMQDNTKHWEAPKTMFQKAMEIIVKVEDDLENLQKFAAQMNKMKHHIVAENNEGRSKMDAAITTHSRKFFSQGMYFVATDRLKSKFLVSDADFPDTNSDDAENEVTEEPEPKETGVLQEAAKIFG